MTRIRTTLTIDEDVMRAVKLRAAKTGMGDSEVIEGSLRRDLGLDFLDRVWQHAEMGEQEAMILAVEAQHATRKNAK